MPALLSIILAGATVAPATPVEANKWFTSQEHPKTALAVADRGFIAYTITVSPDGTALRCEPEGQTDLDRKVCELVMKRARFTPAKNDQGQPVFGVHEGVPSFLMPGKNNGRPDRSKLAIKVDSLPTGATGAAFARVAFAVDATGAISHCSPLPSQSRRQPSFPALGAPACEKLVSEYRPTVARDNAGNAVPSIQSATVRFELAP